jgi:1-deoxy-D-xylulose-5-phosphate reductoisomerase
LEVIEARWLFHLQPDQIRVLIHPQSIVHSMVVCRDQSVLAQLGTPDMRVPIAYGLSWPARIASGASCLDFGQMKAMTFESIHANDHPRRFPGLQLGFEALKSAPGVCAVLNAANEVAVQAFLDRDIRFDQIHAVNTATLETYTPAAPSALEHLLEIDQAARAHARSAVRRMG